MRKFFVSVLTVFLLLCAIAAAGAGVYLYVKYAPSKTLADPAEWFGVTGNQVAIVLDDELESEVVGSYIDGQTYLPLAWVNQNLNERFYWDKSEKQMIYALPESIVYADLETTGSNGKPLIIERDDQIWLATGLVSTYTNIRMELFVEDDVKRIFIDTVWDPQQVAVAKKDNKIRVLGGVKSAIIAEVLKGSEVTVIDTLDSWSRVRTADGYLGYISNKALGDVVDQTLISTFEEPVYKRTALEEPVCLVWHQVTIPEANGAMEELLANTKGVNVISPTWFMLTDNQGNYDSLASKDYVKKAHDKGVQVWPTLDNFNRGDNVRSEILFADTKARQNLIENLMSDVRTYGLDGINLDVEGIRAEAGPHYVQFIRELSISCRKEGVILSVDNYVPSADTAFYNRAEQGRVADYVVVMGYDEHTNQNGPGSVASLSYVKRGIEETAKVVPTEKLIGGIPFFTRIWKVDAEGKTTSTATGFAGARKWVDENQVELYWQEELGQYYGEKKDGSDTYYLWLEDETSLAKKMELIYENNLAGVAGWKLGLEPSSIWEVIQNGLKGK